MVYPKGGPLAEKDRRIAELEAQLAEARRELVSVTDELGCTRDDLAYMVRRIDKVCDGAGMSDGP